MDYYHVFKCCISIFPHRQWCSFRPSPIKNGIYLQTPFCQFVRHFLLAFIAFFPFRVYAKDVLLQLNCHLITKQSFFFLLKKKILTNYWPLFKSLIIIIITTSNNKAEIELYYEAVDFSSAEILVVFVKEESNFVKTFFSLVPD